MSHNKRCYVKKMNKSAAQGSRRVDLMFKQASLKAFTSDFDVCDKGDSLVNKHCLVKCFSRVTFKAQLKVGW